MDILEELGVSKEKFDSMYEESNGFNGGINRNKPSYSGQEDFFSFVQSGAESLVSENKNIIDYMKSGMRG